MKKEFTHKATGYTSTKDPNTNEEVITGIQRYEREPPYVKLYYKDLGSLHDLSKVDTDVFIMITEYIDRRDTTNTVTLVLHQKNKIAAKLGINPRTVDKCIGVLIKKELLIRTAYRALYIVNPRICIRSDFGSIYNVTMHIRYDKDGRTFDIDYEQLSEKIKK